MNISTLQTIRDRFEYGSQQYPHLKVGITNWRDFLVTVAESLCAEPISGWLARRDDSEIWYSFFFDERIAGWQQEILPVVLNPPTPPNLTDAVLAFTKHVDDAEHIVSDSPIVNRLKNDGYYFCWLTLLFTTAWQRRSGSLLFANKQLPVHEYAEILLHHKKVHPRDASRKGWCDAYAQAESELVDRQLFVSYLDPFAASVAMIDEFFDAEERTPDTETDTHPKNPSFPDSPKISGLCKCLKRDLKGVGVKQIDVALEFTNQDKEKAENLRRQARRYKHLWHPEHINKTADK